MGGNADVYVHTSGDKSKKSTRVCHGVTVKISVRKNLLPRMEKRFNAYIKKTGLGRTLLGFFTGGKATKSVEREVRLTKLEDGTYMSYRYDDSCKIARVTQVHNLEVKDGKYEFKVDLAGEASRYVRGANNGPTGTLLGYFNAFVNPKEDSKPMLVD